MKIVALFILVFLGFTAVVKGQGINYSLYMVSFTDKMETPYSFFKPTDYLSPRAIERRIAQGIAIDVYDLPVVPNYVQQVLGKGCLLHGQSKWLNAIAIHTTDSIVLKNIENLPFVKEVRPLGLYRTAQEPKIFKAVTKVDSSKHVPAYYGYGTNQISMLGGTFLHHIGFRGEGVHVAIFDGGFMNTYRMPVFDSLYLQKRILGTHDFVERDRFVYESSQHGTNVLSTMAANKPNFLVGTAPDASYYLFKTEDVKGEFPSEEFNWVVAMEYADSIGVDVVNSSLGYTVFWDDSLSYTYEDLDGKTALASQGANVAVQKGLLIVNSAGNEGDGKWRYIGTPADVDGVFSVAAVDERGKRAYFSSWGPTADGRIKPDIAAQGQNAVIASMVRYEVGLTNGTSFSSPIMAGMVASLRQAYPNIPAQELLRAIKESGHLAAQPDSSLGYGIPNFGTAYLLLMEDGVLLYQDEILLKGGHLVKGPFDVILGGKKEEKINLELYDMCGHLLLEKQVVIGDKQFVLERLDFANFGAEQQHLLLRLQSDKGLFNIPLFYKKE